MYTKILRLLASIDEPVHNPLPEKQYYVRCPQCKHVRRLVETEKRGVALHGKCAACRMPLVGRLPG
jgi:hypothetical protein